ncbi:Matrix-remodeling-associated protein 5 [Triplophysa tibetana]|uniref:Matrix-remodeling-associated protein 5 n=1 Tax=Triplophysa tibetana TaxID=1572043 RepID=A0A5A9P2R6_9TELE|nr:Matrix-remodeling-associated protein 5 [Triplophysa tibetana]
MLMLLVTLPYSRGACPRSCACYAPAEVHCTFRSLVAVPAGISTRVQRINLGFNTINHITDVSFHGLRLLELLMMHGNNVQNIPDGAFQDLESLQILKLSYNKLRIITGHTFSSLTSLIRLHLDNNRIEFIHPDAFHGMTSLRLLHLEGNHLQKLHPETFSTFSVFQRFPVSTLKHLYVSENFLKMLPREMLGNMPQLENIFMCGNPWSCDCTMSWLQNWRTSGVVKCKKDRSFADGRLCPRCSSPQHLKGKQMSDVKEFICSGPTISSSENHITHEENKSELLPLDRIKAPFGNLSLVLLDEHGTRADLFCHILEPRDSTKISWNYTRSRQIAANLTLFFDVECSVNRENYESLWRLLAYYSEVAVHLRREIMLTKHPEVSYRYKQDIEKDAFYYTGVRAEVLTRPAWLMQSFINVKLNRPYSSSKSVRLILNTHVSTVTDQEMIRQQKRSWVMIQQNNKTQTIFSSLVGGMIEMKCDVRSSEVAAVILWMLPDGLRIRAASSTHHNRVTVSNTGTLHIKSVEHADTGVYYCIAEVTGDMDILPFRLAVVDSSTPLQGEDIGSALTRLVGESSGLSCLSVAAPDAVVNWIFPDGTILNSNSSRASIYSNGTLFIPYSQLNNNGYHKCVVMNQHGADVMATKLTVLRRKGAQPLRAYPSRPQSAAGVSTKVKAFAEDVEEASGDEVNTHELIIPNRIFINRRRGQGLIDHGRRRRPFTKDVRAFANQRNAHAKNKMDPQKWADILAKIREKNTRKNPSVHKTPVKSVQRGNEEHPARTDNTEGSSPDDSAQHAYNTPTAHTEEENKNITHTSEVNTITAPQSVSNDVITEERHVGTIRDERTENNQIDSGPVIKPQSETDNKLPLSKTIIRTSVSNSSNSTSVEKEASPDSTQQRARNHLSSRRRYGSRRRMPFRRPFSKLPTNKPQSTTEGVLKSSTVTMNTDQTTQDRDTTVYPTTGDTDHIYLTIIPTESNPTIKTTAHNNPTIPTEDTSVYLSSRDTDQIYSTGDTSINPTPNTYIYPTISIGFVNPTSGETANSYPTIPLEDTSIHQTPRATTHVYNTISTGSVNPTPGATVNNNPTIPPENTSFHPTLKTYPTVPAGDTFVYPTADEKYHDDTVIPPESVYLTPKTTAHENPTIPPQDISVHPTSGETLIKYPTNPTRDRSTYPSPKTTSHIYPTIPPQYVYLTPKTTSHNNPKIPLEDVSVLPAFGETEHIYPTKLTEDKSAHPTPKTTAHIYPTIPSESVYPSTGETDHKHPPIPTGDAFVYPTSVKSAHTHPKTTGYSYPTIPTVHQTTEATVNTTPNDGITGQNKHTTVLQEKEDGDIAGVKVEEYMTLIIVDPTSTPTSALQTDNSEKDTTAEDRFSPQSHSDLRPENDALKRVSVASKEESLQFTSVPSPADRFQEESIQNQVPLPLTTETPTKQVISAARPHGENNEIIFFRPVSTAERPLIVPGPTITSITTKPITTLPLPTTTSSTKTPAVHTTPDQTLHHNIIPFYTRNAGKNHIDAGKHGRVPNTKNRDHYTESINPSGDPSVHIINTQTTSTAGSDHYSTSSNITQSYQTIGVNRKWSEAHPVVQMRPRIAPGKLHTLTVTAGSRVQISCDADGEPKPHLSWTKTSTGAVMSSNTRIQRFEVQSNGTLMIQNVQLQDRGQYVCLAANVYGSDKMTVTLVVSAHVPRVTLPRHRDLRVYLGNSALMECQAQGLPSPNISWVLPDRSVLRTVSESDGMGKKVALFANGTLGIKRTSYLDRGLYKCLASNAAGADMLTVRLQIAALPPMIHQQRRENQTVPDGQDVFIHCTSEGSPSPSVRWVTFSGTQIRPSQFINGNLFVFPNGTLYIRKATEKDSGNYECVAVNSVGVASRTVNVQVKKNSSLVKIISSSSQKIEVQYGGQLSLQCTAAGQPQPRIIWRTPSKKLLHTRDSPVTEKDAGDYLCVARNKMADDYLLVTVNVLMKAAKIQPKPLNNHKVSYGGELKVDCIASGLPDPEIAWSLPDGTRINSVLPSDDSVVRNKRYVVFDNGTLYFNQVGMREEGDYTCYAQNHMGKDEMKVHIQVLADAPVIQNNTYHVLRVHHGETAVLHCSAKGIPPPTVTWTSPTHRVVSPVSNKLQITSDGTLHIHQIQKLDTGNYTCLARNDVGTDRKVVHVEVLADVPVINGFKDGSGIIRRTVVTDRRVLLACRTEGKPVPQITWVLPNNITLPVPYYSWRITVHHNGTLDISSLRMTDTGVFLCMARNEAGEAKLQIHLHVTDDIEQPRLRDLPVEHIPLTDGASVTLSCSVDGRPAPDITWTLPNGTSLLRGTAASRFHHRQDGSLFIRDASVSDAGRYRCVGRNSAGQVERTVMLESGRRPDIFNTYRSLVSIINGENLQLNCQSNGNPEPKLTWTRPDGVILTRPQQTGRHSVLKNGTLSVQRASVYDRGIYVCQTTNQHGSSSLTVSVIVIAYPPRITSGPPAVTYARSGVALQLQCLALATPKAEVMWETPDGIQLKVGIQPRLYGNKYLHPQGSLTIQSPSKQDNGLYKCSAKNVVGSDSRSTYVYVF